MMKYCLLAAVCGAGLGVSSAAQALETGQCLSLNDLNAALKAEGQRIIMIGDQIENPDIRDKHAPTSTGFVVTANDSGSVGYQIRGDKPLAVDQTKFCIGSKLGDLELFDARDAAAAIPRRAYLGGDFNRVVDDMAQGNSRPMLVATLVPDANETGSLRMPFVIFRNVADKNATLAGMDPSSGEVLSFVSMRDVSYTEVGLQRLAGHLASASRMTDAAPMAQTPQPRPVTKANFPDPTQANPVLLFGKEDITMWMVLVSRTHCPSNMVRNEQMTLSEGAWSTGTNPNATYCGQSLVWYQGVMPYTEFREKMNGGSVRIKGQRAQDFTTDTVYRVNKYDAMMIFNELERRQAATLAASAPPPPRTGPIFQYAAASTSPIAAGGPSASDILSAHARSSLKYFGGHLTSVPGEVAFDSIWGGYSHYDQRNIKNYGCAMLAKGKYRCTYDFEKRQTADRGSNWGRTIVAFSQPGYSRNTYTFIFDGKSWNAPELDTENLASKNAADRAAQQSANSWDAANDRAKQEERARKHRECLNDALRDGAMAFCPY